MGISKIELVRMKNPRFFPFGAEAEAEVIQEALHPPFLRKRVHGNELLAGRVGAR